MRQIFCIKMILYLPGILIIIQSVVYDVWYSYKMKNCNVYLFFHFVLLIFLNIDGF